MHYMKNWYFKVKALNSYFFVEFIYIIEIIITGPKNHFLQCTHTHTYKSEGIRIYIDLHRCYKLFYKCCIK